MIKFIKDHYATIVGILMIIAFIVGYDILGPNIFLVK